MVYTTGRFMFNLALLFFLVFLQSFSVVITSLVEDGTGLCASHAFVCLFCTYFSSSWCQGLTVASDCGTPWTFQ